MSEAFILVLDEGTTSTRAVLYRPDGHVVVSEARPLVQHYPGPGMVEHDAAEIWESTLACARSMVAEAGGAERIAAIGITNQRETVVAWDRQSGVPLHRAIVWQDRRTALSCASLKASEDRVQRLTGLKLDPYFSATKFAWLQQQPAVAAARDRLAMGTIESWLTFKLSGRHVTDSSNASRTSLMRLAESDWDSELMALFGVARGALPAVIGNVGRLAETKPELFGLPIPICAMIGDQQSATIGQGCVGPGMAKLTLGTGAFALAHVGQQPSSTPGDLLSTVLLTEGDERAFALEGSIFVAGSLMQWLRDQLGLIVTAGESEALARSVDDTGGVMLLPALSGLGAPYWRPEARAMITGMSFATTRAHLARAALEAVSHQCVDLASAFAKAGTAWTELRIDGGMSANDWLAQDLADMLDLEVIRPDDVETTARGAAILAAVGARLYPDVASAASAMRPGERRFTASPQAGPMRRRRMNAWHDLLRAAGVTPP